MYTLPFSILTPIISPGPNLPFDTIFFLKQFDKVVYVVKKELKLDTVGLSDHSNPHEDNLLSSKLAIFQGIDVLERHFTILDKDETRDGKVSVTPNMIAELINFSKKSKIRQYKEINKFNDLSSKYSNLSLSLSI